VDFGPAGESNGGRMMAWTESVDSIRSVYLVFAPHNGCRCLLGTTAFPSDIGGWTYDFMGNGSGLVYVTMANAMCWNNSSIYVNGVQTNYTYTPVEGFQLIEIHTTAGAHASGFACDRVSESYGNYEDYRGGQYLGEVVVYDRELTEREKIATRNYLMGKWFNGAAAKVPAKTDDGVVFAKLSATGGTFESAKPVSVQTLAGRVTVAAGTTLTVPLPGTISSDGFPTDGLIARFDATAGVTTNPGYSDTRSLQEWVDQSGSGWKCVPLVDGDGTAPLVCDGDGGRKIVRMGWNSKQALRFKTANGEFAEMTGIRSVFWVLDAEFGGGFLLGGGHSADNSGRHYNFHRGNAVDGSDWSITNMKLALLHSSLSDFAARNATWRIDGTEVTPTTTGFTKNWNLISMRTADTDTRPSTSAEGFAFDGRFLDDGSNSDRCGCQFLSEALIYDRVLSDDECRQVEAYLSRKWKLGVYQQDVSSNPARVTLEAGATVDLGGKVQCFDSIAGAGSFSNGSLQTGAVKAGADAALAETLSVSGDFAFTGGAEWTLEFNSDGTPDLLSVTGTLAFGEDMTVKFLNLAAVGSLKDREFKVAEAGRYVNVEALKRAVFTGNTVSSAVVTTFKQRADGIYLLFRNVGTVVTFR